MHNYVWQPGKTLHRVTFVLRHAVLISTGFTKLQCCCSAWISARCKIKHLLEPCLGILSWFIEYDEFFLMDVFDLVCVCGSLNGNLSLTSPLFNTALFFISFVLTPRTQPGCWWNKLTLYAFIASFCACFTWNVCREAPLQPHLN